MSWISLDKNGGVAVQRIVAFGIARSTAMRRLVAATPQPKLIDATGNRRRHTVLILDSGHVVLTTLTVDELRTALALAGSGLESF